MITHCQPIKSEQDSFFHSVSYMAWFSGEGLSLSYSHYLMLLSTMTSVSIGELPRPHGVREKEDLDPPCFPESSLFSAAEESCVWILGSVICVSPILLGGCGQHACSPSLYTVAFILSLSSLCGPWKLLSTSIDARYTYINF